MQINDAIARQIVERTMKIIPYSVNVMNELGHIIASGDPARIRQRHEGSILAINENRIVAIDSNSAEQLKGVKPGINLPIIHQDNIIGVVGISGEPEQVKPFGELVRMTAELIIEQAELMAQVQWSKRHREELLIQLLSGEQQDLDSLHAIADKLSLNPEIPRVATVIQMVAKKQQLLSLEHLQQLVQMLEHPDRDNLVGIVSVLDNLVVVLKPISLNKHGWSQVQEKKRLKQLIERVDHNGNFTIKVAVGDYFPHLTGLAKSFQTAKATLNANKHKTGRVFFFSEHRLPVLIDVLKQDNWRQNMLLEPISKLYQHDRQGVLIKTLKHFFEQNCDQTITCSTLHIHRNTLRYRLEKIEQITSLNINNLEHKIQLYLALNIAPNKEAFLVKSTKNTN